MLMPTSAAQNHLLKDSEDEARLRAREQRSTDRMDSIKIDSNVIRLKRFRDLNLQVDTFWFLTFFALEADFLKRLRPVAICPSRFPLAS